MSIRFAANLSTLRREKNITQKTAAEALGVSQALLSHYEKGIRECNLDFVVKTAQYYEVTADYLLGLSTSKHGSNEIFEAEPMPSDSQIKTKTVLRSFLQFLDQAEKSGNEYEAYFNDYFSLCMKKYILSLKKGKDNKIILSETAQKLLKVPEVREGQNAAFFSVPLCVKTVEEHAEKLIKTKFEDAVQ